MIPRQEDEHLRDLEKEFILTEIRTFCFEITGDFCEVSDWLQCLVRT